MLFLIALALVLPDTRAYYRLSLKDLATSTRTHVEVTARVVYVRHQDDGDWHLTLEQDGVKAVAEIIPAIPFPVPKKGQRCTVRGIARYDRWHKWNEVHPVEALSCE